MRIKKKKIKKKYQSNKNWMKKVDSEISIIRDLFLRLAKNLAVDNKSQGKTTVFLRYLKAEISICIVRHLFQKRFADLLPMIIFSTSKKLNWKI